ncbi:MAG: hypothetical protein ABSF76_06415 [Opitutaceae bacterium]|jgi:hypothetical protein
MHTRLLAFLEETQRAIVAGRPRPLPDADWHTSRSVNYRLGLARLALGARDKTGKVAQLGSVLVQAFKLADESLCLKANLAWQENDAEIAHPIFANPHLNWGHEAIQLANTWIAGPPAKVTPMSHEPEMLAAG